MKQISSKIKPAAGFSHFIHIALNCLLPALLFVFVRIEIIPIAIAIILLSKWRMFAVKPRHWPANVRANSVDIIVGLSILLFMSSTDSQMYQLLWAIGYGIWLTVIKPQSSILGVTLQAFIGQTIGLVALFIVWGGAPTAVLIIGAWVICYNSARHFFGSFEENMTRYLSGVWAYIAASMVWILSHWLLFYGAIAQPALILSVLSFGMGSIYYLDKTDRISVLLKRQIVFIVSSIIVIVLIFSEWGDKAI